MKRVGAAIAAAALLVPLPLQAAAPACLDRETLAAARVHEFEAMMMTVNLRCRTIGVDISGDFEAMLKTHAAVFAAAGRRMRAHFAGPGRAYERYATGLGNRYGAGATDPANCRRFDSVALGLAAKPALAELGKIVSAMVAQPRITGAICPRP